MNKYAIVFDVGGLFIKAAVMDRRGQVVPGTYGIYPSRSKKSKEEILDHFIELIKQQAGFIMDRNFRIEGIGYAFPGPFDYDRGICFIEEVDKYEALFGVNVHDELLERLERESFFANKKDESFRIAFENDASLFALGEYTAGKARPYGRSICMTIGTGTGSAFLENGVLVKHRDDVPPNGWIYRQPYRESIVDDYISKRGILRILKETGTLEDDMDIKALAERAKNGEERAADVFRTFGERIGEMLIPYVRSFRPEAVIIGGQIVGSQELFLPGTRDALQEFPVAVEVTAETSLSTFAGVWRLLDQKKRPSAW